MMFFRKPIALVATLVNTFTASAVVVAITIIAFISLLLLLSSILYVRPAFSDGLFQDQLSASVGERKVDLFIKMTPPVITTETLKKGQKPAIEFRVFNSNNNGTYFHVTYQISIQKGNQTLLNQWFHHHYGDLKLEIIPKNIITAKVYAQKDPILDTYTGTLETPIVVEGPIFLEGGLYHFKVRIVTLDEDTLVLPDNQQTVYEDSLSIGDIENKTISIGDKQVPVDIISYYDKINDFEFDNKTMQMQFDMPFDWDINRLNKTNIFVHQEITIPTSNDFASNRSYFATVNGIDVSKSLMLDNSNPKKDVIHIMLSKNQIIQSADKLSKSGQPNAELMKFVLKPGSNSNSMQQPMTSHGSV
ncbi:MAG: hypothetical protein ACJ709_04640 [Nitrososphaeraceae archaeon]